MLMRTRRLLLVVFAAALGAHAGCIPVSVPVLPTGTPPASDVTFRIDSSLDRRYIYPTIYGVNEPTTWSGKQGVTLMRLGGNRWTAYNWENNASNAGSDWHNQNDGYLSGGNTPGEAVRTPVANAFTMGAAAIVTIPMAGYVAADKLGGGDVNQTPNYLDVRFRRSLPAKGAPFASKPDTSDAFVYQDEFVAWLESRFPGAHGTTGHRLFYALDNEPDLWAYTHARIHPSPVRYDELVDRTIDMASAIKNVAPKAMVFGPVSYGWNGFVTLQDAPDASAHGDFLDWYLDELRAEETRQGRTLVDVLDLHWYPEATGGGQRITDGGTSPAVVDARLQAPRSLWDPTYTETSWITQWSTGGPIALLPRMQAKIHAHKPGTLLALSEYNYGDGSNISGGIAEADVLGIFGREGVFAATLWELAPPERYLYGALAMYRNYDGAGGAFGDVSVRATTDDIVRSSVYASVDALRDDRMVLVALNKTASPLTAGFAVAHTRRFSHAEVYLLTSASWTPARAADLAIAPDGTFQASLPADSVVTLVLRP
ncbi:MAG TPA: glycoside hydrolase family 44 protein [Myxococcota bacterium]|nr:glycoside hydrolase family 44 protein [Myxococcota bacterium]